MPDRYWGRIQFPVAMIDEDIREALEAVGVVFQNGRPVEVAEFVEINEGIFRLEDSQAEEGAFEDLEDTLEVEGVPFDRESAEYFDYAAEKVIFRPGKNGNPPLQLVHVLSDGVPSVKLPELLELMAQGMKAIRSYVNSNFPTYPPLSDYVKEG